MPKDILFLLLFIFGAVGLSAQPGTGTPSITIQEGSIRVGKLLKEISRQSGADFSYNSKLLDTSEKIAFHVKDASLEETLLQLTQELEIAYTLVEGQIVLNFADPAEEEILEEKFTLSGFLSDQSTGENLISASVAVKGTNQGTFTNEFGYYALSLKKGTYTILCSYVGFEPVELEIDLRKNTQQLVFLPPSTIDLPEVLVGMPLPELMSKSQLSEMDVAPADLNTLPEFGGESGLIKGLQSLPGIQTHSDGSAFFYTRGGERDQNLIIIDDAPIYNPSHLFGFYSIVVPDFTKQITIYKSDLPASMGDRLSSIISIRTRDGNLNKVEFSGALNPLINRFTFSAPMFKKRSSIFLSVRRSNFEWIFRNATDPPGIQFWDIHLKWNFKINDNNRIFFTSIRGGDVFGNEGGPVNGIRWGNTAATLRWNHIFGPKLFSNTTLYSGTYAYTLTSAPSYWKSELGTLSLKTDFTNYIGPKYTAKFGFELQGFFTNPGELVLDSTVNILPSLSSDLSRKGVLYYQGEIKATEKLQLNLGLRFIKWDNLGPKLYYDFDENYEVSDTIFGASGVYNEYINVDPRVSIQYQLDSTSQVKLSYGMYHQYLQLIQNSISPFTSFEVWLPAGPNIRPQASSQWALNYLKLFPRSNLEFGASAYFKRSFNQIDYEAHATTYLNPLLESELRFGESRAYGLELLFKKEFGRLNGWIGYTYSRVFRQTKDLNNDEWYPAFQDRPHDLAIVLNYKLAPRVIATAFWTSHSGSTFTSPVGFYTFNGQTIPLYGDRNNDRLPAYHRLDLAFQFIFNKREDAKYQHSLTFSIFNVLAHQNVFTVKFNKQYSESLFPRVPVNVATEQLLSASQIDLIRFFPSLTYKFNL